MVFEKQYFEELSIFQLLQNVWSYNHSILDDKERGRVDEVLISYLNWNEEILIENWNYSELPRLSFILKEIKQQKELYDPGACFSEKNYINFLKGLKKVYGIILYKLQLTFLFFSFLNQYLLLTCV